MSLEKENLAFLSRLGADIAFNIRDNTIEDFYELLDLTKEIVVSNNLQEDKKARVITALSACCGDFLMANEDLSEVEIMGCDSGTDWSVIHEGGTVKIVLSSGTEERIDFSDYQAEVFRFADKKEAYYNACEPKIFPEEFDNFDQNGYRAFWNEWHRRRNITHVSS